MWSPRAGLSTASHPLPAPEHLAWAMVPNRGIYVSPHNCPALQPLLCCTICQRQSWPLAFCRPSGGFPIPPSAGLWARSKAAEKPAPCRLQQEPLDGSKAFRKGRWGKRLCRELGEPRTRGTLVVNPACNKGFIVCPAECVLYRSPNPLLFVIETTLSFLFSFLPSSFPPGLF